VGHDWADWLQHARGELLVSGTQDVASKRVVVCVDAVRRVGCGRPPERGQKGREGMTE